MTDRQLTARIEEWLGRICLSEQGVGAGGGGLELRAKDPGSRVSEKVRDYPLSHEIDPKLLASGIVLDAHEEAEGNGPGTHAFVVLALRNGDRTPFAKRSFLIHVDATHEGVDVEEATSRGLVAQLMRHNEAMSRIYTGTLPVLVHAMQALLSSANQRLEIHDKQHVDVLRAQADLAKAQAELEVDAMSKIKKQERIDKVLEKAIDVAPLLLAKLTEPTEKSD